MATRKANPTSDLAKGLHRAVDDAANPAMKRLGQRALELGFSQESLAKELRERFRLSAKTNGANVYAHLTSARPQRETIARYAEIVGFTGEQLYVLEHGAIPPGREWFWERELLRLFDLAEADFEPGVREAVTEALQNEGTRARVFASMALPPSMPRRILPRIRGLLDIAADALIPDLDLRKFMRERTPGDTMFALIYPQALALYKNPTKTLQFIDACAAILRLDGFDTHPMHLALISDLARPVSQMTISSRKDSS